MEKQVAWQEGAGNILVTEQTVASDTTNESLDREQAITYRTTRGTDIRVQRTVRQEGKRERFNAADGLMRLADGGTFQVLKAKWGGVKRLFYKTLDGVFLTSSGKPFKVKE